MLLKWGFGAVALAAAALLWRRSMGRAPSTDTGESKMRATGGTPFHGPNQH